MRPLGYIRGDGKLDSSHINLKEENRHLSKSNRILREKRNQARRQAITLAAGHLITCVFLFLLYMYAVGSEWEGAAAIGMTMLVPLAFVLLTEGRNE